MMRLREHQQCRQPTASVKYDTARPHLYDDCSRDAIDRDAIKPAVANGSIIAA